YRSSPQQKVADVLHQLFTILSRHESVVPLLMRDALADHIVKFFALGIRFLRVSALLLLIVRNGRSLLDVSLHGHRRFLHRRFSLLRFARERHLLFSQLILRRSPAFQVATSAGIVRSWRRFCDAPLDGHTRLAPLSFRHS
ncbi:hypothetical protein PFISCL1PPCAC_23395, partial [Pristionchus fissidentatus]